MDRDVYVFRFDTQRTADYWRSKTLNKFKDEIINADDSLGSLEFEDSIYYFWNRKRISGLAADSIEYSLAELQLILGTNGERKPRPTVYIG